MLRSFFRNIKFLLLFVAIVAGTWALQRWVASEEIILVDGKKVSVIDGDSFKAGDQEFRIYGIDAPEYLQTCRDKSDKEWRCGSAARSGLKSLLGEGEFSCEVRARDQYQRAIVTCADPKETDLGATMVERGLAVSGYNFDDSIYGVEEKKAKTAKRGIWQGPFDTPDNWRTKNPRGRRDLSKTG